MIHILAFYLTLFDDLRFSPIFGAYGLIKFHRFASLGLLLTEFFEFLGVLAVSTSRSCIGYSGVSGVFVFVTEYGLIRMALCVGLFIELIPWRTTLKICCGTCFEWSSRPWTTGIYGFLRALVW